MWILVNFQKNWATQFSSKIPKNSFLGHFGNKWYKCLFLPNMRGWGISGKLWGPVPVLYTFLISTLKGGNHLPEILSYFFNRHRPPILYLGTFLFFQYIDQNTTQYPDTFLFFQYTHKTTPNVCCMSMVCAVCVWCVLYAYVCCMHITLGHPQQEVTPSLKVKVWQDSNIFRFYIMKTFNLLLCSFIHMKISLSVTIAW